MTTANDLEGAILSAVRRIVRAIDLHSRELVRQHRVTGPQLVTLRAVAELGPVPVSALARSVSLSQPTVTGILVRLERQGLIERQRSGRDRRAVVSNVTAAGRAVLDGTPPLLQDRFQRELARLETWERTQILATLQRIASMMDAEQIAAEPLLATEPLPSADEIQASDAVHRPSEAPAGRPGPIRHAAGTRPVRSSG